MPLNKIYIKKLKRDSLSYAERRRDVIKHADDALHLAKRAIFAIHRDDLHEAKQKLDGSKTLLLELDKKYSNDKRLSSEGAFRAATEEFVEATLFYNFQTVGKIGAVKGLEIPAEIYLGGLCDVPGELLRYAIKAATDRDVSTVNKCAAMAQEICGELIEFNLTKHLRHKFDQAKTAAQRLERVVYDLSLSK